MNDTIKIKGHVNATLYGETGEVKQVFDADNLIVNAGKNWLLSRIASNTNATASLVAIGTNATAASAADTTLGALIYSKNGDMVSAPYSHTVTVYFTPGEGTGTITEYGLYASGSSLIGRVVSGSMAKGAGDTMRVIYTLTVT